MSVKCTVLSVNAMANSEEKKLYLKRHEGYQMLQSTVKQEFMKLK